jgi:hypothetical protein
MSRERNCIGRRGPMAKTALVTVATASAVAGLWACSAPRQSLQPQSRVSASSPDTLTRVPHPTPRDVCTTTLVMKANRVVVRSGGCPDGAAAGAVRTHTADVEAAVRQLQPGEETTVSTVATPPAP